MAFVAYAVSDMVLPDFCRSWYSTVVLRMDWTPGALYSACRWTKPGTQLLMMASHYDSACGIASMPGFFRYESVMSGSDE